MKVKFEYKKLRQQREALKMSQFRLAELADTSDRYIRGMESGKKTNPSVGGSTACAAPWDSRWKPF